MTKIIVIHRKFSTLLRQWPISVKRRRFSSRNASSRFEISYKKINKWKRNQLLEILTHLGQPGFFRLVLPLFSQQLLSGKRSKSKENKKKKQIILFKKQKGSAMKISRFVFGQILFLYKTFLSICFARNFLIRKKEFSNLRGADRFPSGPT
jgi:hypothetical protein